MLLCQTFRTLSTDPSGHEVSRDGSAAYTVWMQHLIGSVCLIYWNTINLSMDFREHESSCQITTLMSSSDLFKVANGRCHSRHTTSSACFVLLDKPVEIVSFPSSHLQTEQRVNIPLSLSSVSSSASFFCGLQGLVFWVLGVGSTVAMPVKTKLLCDFTLTCFKHPSQHWETAAAQQTAAECFINERER